MLLFSLFHYENILKIIVCSRLASRYFDAISPVWIKVDVFIRLASVWKGNQNKHFYQKMNILLQILKMLDMKYYNKFSSNHCKKFRKNSILLFFSWTDTQSPDNRGTNDSGITVYEFWIEHRLFALLKNNAKFLFAKTVAFDICIDIGF